MLVEVLSDITTGMEDNRAGVVLSAIDFSKAFNRLDHSKCLAAFAKKGASTQILKLLATFLLGRRMAVRLEGEISDSLPINAGAPQGSVLGCYLFNIGVDDLEEGFNNCGVNNLQSEVHEETLNRSDDFPAASTPSRVGHHADLTESPIARSSQQFTLLPRVANALHWVKKPKDPTFRSGDIKTYKYVDDQVNTSKINMRRARLLLDGEEYFKEVTDNRTQDLLGHIAANAEAKGMAINASKTGLMLVSAASSFDARVKVQISDETVHGQEHMRILGVTVDRDASFKTHVNKLAKKLRSKTWALSRLRKKGLSEEKLTRTYKCLIRPTVEYASPAWHSLLTAGQAAELERQQAQALKNIFGPGISANKMRERAGVSLWSTRRENAVKKFAMKCLSNPRCETWFRDRGFPSYPRRSGVNYP